MPFLQQALESMAAMEGHATFSSFASMPSVSSSSSVKTAFAATDEAAYNAAQLAALTRFRSQHRRTKDGRLCAPAFVHNHQTFTNCET